MVESIPAPSDDVDAASRQHVRIVASAESGWGVAATRDFAAGEIVLVFRGRRLSHRQIADFTHCLEIAPGKYLGPSGGADDYVNHSCRPNCHVSMEDGRAVLRTHARIRKGEELTMDYSAVMWRDPTSFLCRCGEPGCRGKIGNFARLPQATQAGYIARGWVPDFVLAEWSPGES